MPRVGVCIKAGCPEQVERPERYCPGHQPVRDYRAERRSPSSLVTSSTEFKRLRARVFRAARYRCQADGCDERAKHVDHIVPVSRGGAPYDLSNLQALCAPCNLAKGAR